MAKLKNILLMALSFALVAALAIGGTVAYLTDTESTVNVMTLGNVKIEQHEYQRAEGVAHNAGESGKGNGIDKGDLVPFVQGQALYPAVPKNNAPTDYTAEATDLFFWGDYVYSGTAGNGLWNDNNLSNVMDKMVFVENTGKSDAYFRTIIAYECPEGITIGEPSQGAEIMINRNGSTIYDWEDIGYITVDGVRYFVVVATYQNVLNPGAQSHPSLLQVVMTHHATNEDMELLGNTYDILVLSQAVQVKGFDGAKTALDTAFGNVADKAAEWFGGMKVPAPVSTADELKNALSKGGNVILTDDIELTETLMPTKDVVIDLNGKTIKTTTTTSLFQSQSNAAPSMIITSSTAGAVIDATNSTFSNGVVHSYGKTEIRNVTINAGSNKVVQVQGNGSVEIYDTVINADSGNPFNVAGDFTLGKGSVVNITKLTSNLINNNGAHAIVIDGAKINVGEIKINSPVISLNKASTLEMKNTKIKIDNFVLSPFGGEGLVNKIDGVTIENCTFDVTDSNGASCTFVADAELGRYDLVQK